MKINRKKALSLSFLLLASIMLVSYTLRTRNNSHTNQITLFSNETPKEVVDFTIEKQTVLENAQAFFDFDNEKITNTEKADIYLSVGCGTDCFNEIFDINGSQSVEVGSTQPSYEKCIKALQEQEFPWVAITPGNYSCLITSEGNIVRILTLENKSHSQNAKFTFEYTIWYTKP